MSSKTKLQKFTAGVSTFAVGIGLAAVVAAPASADFDLTSGRLAINPASVTGAPPTSGSWVTLPTDNPLATPNYFDNTGASNTATGQYTSIDGSNQGAGEGIRIGATQASGAFDTANTTFGPYGFDAEISSSFPTTKLRFEGDDTSTTAEPLVQNTSYSDLTAFQIIYPAGTAGRYDVGGRASAGGKYLAALDGALNPSTDEYVLDWHTDITEPGGFQAYQAKFHLEGDYYGGSYTNVP